MSKFALNLGINIEDINDGIGDQLIFIIKEHFAHTGVKIKFASGVRSATMTCVPTIVVDVDTDGVKDYTSDDDIIETILKKSQEVLKDLLEIKNSLVPTIQTYINEFCEENDAFSGKVEIEKAFNGYRITLIHKETALRIDFLLSEGELTTLEGSLRPVLMMQLSRLKFRLDKKIIQQHEEANNSTFILNVVSDDSGSFIKTTHKDRDYELVQQMTLQQIKESEQLPFIVGIRYNDIDGMVSISLFTNELTTKFIPSIADKIAEDCICIMNSLCNNNKTRDDLTKFNSSAKNATIQLLDTLCQLYNIKSSGHMMISNKMQKYYSELINRPELGNKMSYGEMMHGLVHKKKAYTKLSWGNPYLKIRRNDPTLTYDSHCKPIPMPPYVELCQRKPDDYIGTCQPFVPCYDDMFANDWVEVKSRY